MGFAQVVRRFATEQRGTETVEWSVVAGIIVTGVIAVIGLLSNQIVARFTTMQTGTS